ncbi:MAG: glutathione S-transferase [Burkholderiales bacterium]|nr:glutathione S-transferase [Burkholderiales bacterium]
MQLIGMLDSPYVRRVAISLQRLGLPFIHRSISVFRGFAQFQQINPVVKAPTLVCDDGTVLMDSTLILHYAEAVAPPGRRLMPTEPAALALSLETIGLALAACEKSVQIVYERKLRPPEKQHAPWLERVSGQMLTAFDALEAQLAAQALPLDRIDQAGISVAVTWHFARQMLPELLSASTHPRLQAFSTQAEALPEFVAAPHGEGVYQPTP